jgi:hypothetical protein
VRLGQCAVPVRQAQGRLSGTRLLTLSLPGTSVPGYRLSRPFGTQFVSRVLMQGFKAVRFQAFFGTTKSRALIQSPVRMHMLKPLGLDGWVHQG